MTMALTSEFDPERLVIDAIRSGDRTAFGELVRRHDHWVRGVVFGVLGQQDRVDDAVQQVWTTAWERINELRDPARWRAWLYRLARNAALDAGRDIARRRKRMQELARHAVSANSGSPRCASDPASGGSQDPALTLGARIDDAIVSDETTGEVLGAIEALPAIYREPFVLRHLSGWSYREIADVMDMPVDSVETRLVRARRLLRETLKDKLL